MDSPKFNKGHSYNHHLLSHDAWEGTGREQLLDPWCVAVEGLEREAATLQDVALKQWRKYIYVCHPRAPPAFRMPEWDFWTQWEPSCPCCQHPEQRTGWKSDGGETHGNGCTVVSPRGWLALHLLGLWSSLELVLSLTLKLQASAVPKSDLSVFRDCETVRLWECPPPILCDIQALPGLQVAVTFKSMMLKPQSLPLIFCQAAGFLSARKVPWTHMSRGALARHSWNTLIFKNQSRSSAVSYMCIKCTEWDKQA